MDDMHSGGGIHHGGHHDVHAWEAPAEGQIQGEGKAEGKAHVKHHKVINLNTDEIEKPGQAETTQVHHRGMERKAQGFGYATLSQYDLDALQTGDPQIFGHKGVTKNAPPAGPGGTGNPFFNPNPMVMFYTCFFKVMQMMKWLEMVATKLAVNDLKIVKEAGKNQANATLEAGKAAFRSEMSQAITSFVQAGVGLAMMGASSFSLIKAFKKADAQQALKLGAKDRADTLKKAGQENLNAQEASLKKGISAKKGFMATRPGGVLGKADDADPQFKVRKEGGENPLYTSKAKEKHIKVEKNNQQQQQQNLNAMKKSSQEAEMEWKQYERQAKKLGMTDDDARMAADNKMRQSILRDESKLSKQQFKQQKLDTDFEQAQSEYDAAKSGKLKHIGEYMQQDPVYLMFQAGTGTANNMLMGLGHYFKGRGELEQAYWNAEAQKYGMYLQIGMKGLDSAMQIMQDTYQQAGEIAQTLTKMSDQEQSSMRWSA